MAVPKKRTSQSKTRNRKAAWFAKAWQKSAYTLNVYQMITTLNQRASVTSVKMQQSGKVKGFGKPFNQKPSPMVKKPTI